MDGKQKSELYAKYKVSLKSAIRYEFWLQAIFIEYALLEDRTESVIRHAGGIKLINGRGNPLSLSEKINKIRACAAFSDKKIRKYFSPAFLDSVIEWKQQRDGLIHALMKTPNNDDRLKEVALAGEALVKVLDNRVKSVNRIFDKIRCTDQ